jgi:hypothetical protein
MLICVLLGNISIHRIIIFQEILDCHIAFSDFGLKEYFEFLSVMRANLNLDRLLFSVESFFNMNIKEQQGNENFQE